MKRSIYSMINRIDSQNGPPSLDTLQSRDRPTVTITPDPTVTRQEMTSSTIDLIPCIGLWLKVDWSIISLCLTCSSGKFRNIFFFFYKDELHFTYKLTTNSKHYKLVGVYYCTAHRFTAVMLVKSETIILYLYSKRFDFAKECLYVKLINVTRQERTLRTLKYVVYCTVTTVTYS